MWLCFLFQGFNWTRFIQGVLSSVSIKVLLEEEVVVYSSPYLEKMNDILPKHSVRSAYRHDSAPKMRRNPQQLTPANVSFQNYAELPHVAAHRRQGQQLESPFQRCQSPLQEGKLIVTQLLFQPVTSLTTRVIRLFMGPRQRTLGGGNASVMSRAAWRMQLELCTSVKPLLERANKW